MLFRSLITSAGLADAPIGVALIDAGTTTYVAVNHAYAALLGRARRDLVGQSIEVGRAERTPMAPGADVVRSVIRGEVDSITMTLPVPGESAIVQTATLHAIGERRRHSRYLVFYLLCGAAATMVHVLFNGDSRVPTIGASGAIAGVMGAYVVKFPHSRITTLVPVFVFLTTMEIPAYFIQIGRAHV